MRLPIGWDQAGGEFEGVVLAVVIRIERGCGIGIVQAEETELPVVGKAVAGVAAEVVGNRVEHGQFEDTGGSGVVALRDGGGVFINDGCGGQTVGADPAEGTGHHAPGHVSGGQRVQAVVIEQLRGAELPGGGFVGGGGRGGELQRGYFGELAEVTGFGRLGGRGDRGNAGDAAERTLRKLAKSLDVPFEELRVCYEAGPTGFVLSLAG
jgi:hypothetical protein